MPRKAIYDEDLRLNLILNGKGVTQGNKALIPELGKLEREMIALEAKARSAAVGMKKLEDAGRKNSIEYKTLKKQFDQTGISMKALDGRIRALRNEIGLAGMTLQQLRNHLKALQSQLTVVRGNPALVRKIRAEIAATNFEITKITTGAGRFAQAWQRAAQVANRMGTIIGWMAIAFYGFWTIVDKFVTRMKDLEDTIGGVRRTTGLTRDEVWSLKTAFDNMGTRTATKDLLGMAKIAGKLGIEGKDNIMGFVRAANMIQVALGEDLGGDVEQTMTDLGKLVKALRLDKEMPLEDAMIRMGSVLNELDKSSEAAAGNALNFVTKWSSVGNAAKMTGPQLAALAATLDMLNIPVEMGATAVQKLIMAMGENKNIGHFARLLGVSADEYERMVNHDSFNTFMKLMGYFAQKPEGLTELSKSLLEYGITEERATIAFGAIVKNLDRVDQQLKITNKVYSEGTSILEEYEIMNRNFAGQIEMEKKKLGAITEMMGKKLQPTLLAIVRGWTNFIIALKNAGVWIADLTGLFKIIAGLFLILKANVMATSVALWINKQAWAQTTMAMKLHNMAAFLTILMTKNLTMEQKRQIISSKALYVAHLLLTGQFTRMFKVMAGTRAAGLGATAMFGGAAVAVAVLTAGLVLLVGGLINVNKRNSIYLESQGEFNKKLEEGTANANELFDALKRLEPGSSAYNKLKEKLLGMYPEILRNYNLEIEGLKGIEKAQRAVNAAITNRMAIENKKQDIQKLNEKFDTDFNERLKKAMEKNLPGKYDAASRGSISAVLQNAMDKIKEGNMTQEQIEQFVESQLDIPINNKLRDFLHRQIFLMNKEFKKYKDDLAELNEFYFKRYGIDRGEGFGFSVESIETAGLDALRQKFEELTKEIAKNRVEIEKWEKKEQSVEEVAKAYGNIAQRTNNPGNIKWGNFAKGAGGFDSGIVDKTDGTTYAMFQNEIAGFNAMEKLLKSKNYKNLTFDAAMKRWSGGGYGAEVSSEIDAMTKMIDLTDFQIKQLMTAIATREGYYAEIKMVNDEGKLENDIFFRKIELTAQEKSIKEAALNREKQLLQELEAVKNKISTEEQKEKKDAETSSYTDGYLEEMKKQYENEFTELQIIKTKQANDELKSEEWLNEQKIAGEINYQEKMVALLEHYRGDKDKEQEYLSAKLKLYELYRDRRKNSEKEQYEQEEKNESKHQKKMMEMEVDAIEERYGAIETELIKKKIATNNWDETYQHKEVELEIDKERELVATYQKWSAHWIQMAVETKEKLADLQTKYDTSSSKEMKNKYKKDIETLNGYLSDYSEWGVEFQKQSVLHYRKVYSEIDKLGGTVFDDEKYFNDTIREDEKLKKEFETTLNHLYATEVDKTGLLKDRSEKYNVMKMEAEKATIGKQIAELENLIRKREEILNNEMNALRAVMDKETDPDKQKAIQIEIDKKQVEINQIEGLETRLRELKNNSSEIEKAIWDDKISVMEAGLSRMDQLNSDYLSKVIAFNRELQKTMADTTMEASLKEEKIKALKNYLTEANNAEAKSWANSTASAIENAETIQEATAGVLNAIRSRIAALLAEAVATQIAKALTKVPFPLNLVVAAGAAAATALLFETLVPKFSTSKSGKLQTKTMQYAGGYYPVIGADDGKSYNATYNGRVRTGIYGNPTVMDFSNGKRLVGETRLPELVVDGNTFRNLRLNSPQIVSEIYAAAGRMPQYAKGSYPKMNINPMSQFDKSTIAALTRFSDTMEQVSANGIRTYIPLYGNNSLDEGMHKRDKFRKRFPKE